MKKENIVIIGSSSEVANSFTKLIDKKRFNVYLVSRRDDRTQQDSFLKVDDYITDSEKITNFLAKKNNLKVIFFNGFLAENRISQIPTSEEINKTDFINFQVPYVLTRTFENNLKNVDKYIYISSMAAVRPRHKNYIYGLSKSKLETSIKLLNPKKYLFIRFGKIITNMSKDHKDPPFVMTPESAGNFILKNLNSNGIIYPKFQLKVISYILKIIPFKLMKYLKY
tara:strand:- start:5070 stop:5744 length:675 start_codon:yes stop_codon:yes gene_type:complete